MAKKSTTTTNLLTETAYRVYKMPEALRDNCKAAREKRAVSKQEFIQQAIDDELAALTKGLTALGITAAEDTRPDRLPLTDEILDSLRESSAETGLPQSTLLLACLSLASNRKRRKRSK